MPRREFQRYEFDCKTQIPVGSGNAYNYECTITFNPTLYTVASAYNDGLPLVKEKLCEWLAPTTVDYLCIVTEYQKGNMAHLHCLIGTETKLEITFCANLVKGLQRIAGRSTFKPVIDVPSYEQYMSKDLESNFLKSDICHYEVYFNL